MKECRSSQAVAKRITEKGPWRALLCSDSHAGGDGTGESWVVVPIVQRASIQEPAVAHLGLKTDQA